MIFQSRISTCMHVIILKIQNSLQVQPVLVLPCVLDLYCKFSSNDFNLFTYLMTLPYYDSYYTVIDECMHEFFLLFD